MTTRSALPVALVAATVLLVSCASESDSDDDKIEGAQTEAADSPEASASETAEEDDGIDRPEINLPDDMHNEFEDTETGDETKDAIIRDVTEGINATDMAISKSDPNLDAVEFYFTDEGLISNQNYIRDAAESGEAGRSWKGTVEFYDFGVNNEDRRNELPIVTYCYDTTEADTFELATGEVLKGEEFVGGQEQLQVVVEKNELGVWQVTKFLSDDEAGDQQCAR